MAYATTQHFEVETDSQPLMAPGGGGGGGGGVVNALILAHSMHCLTGFLALYI